jgi:glycosyltransferase involved in cell wall biosynthesis
MTEVMRRSKVRTIVHAFSTFKVGGPQIRFAQVANELGDRFRHVICSMDSRYEARAKLDPALSVVLVEDMAPPGNLLARLDHYRRFLRANRPQLLVTYNWGAIEWAIANLAVGVPHVHVEDGFGPDEADRQFLRRIWLRRLALARADVVVVPSETLHSIARRIWKLRPSRIRLIPNGVDPSRYDRAPDAAFRARFDLPAGSPLVGWVGALRREKNLERLLRAFASTTHDAYLLLIGDGPEREELRSIVRTLSLGHRVRFLGQQGDVSSLLVELDVFALSSDTEQMPLAVLEAMAAGLPIASVDVGDVRAMVAPENRRFIVGRTDEALASALTHLLDDDSLRKALGRANRERVTSRYHLRDMMRAYENLLEQLVPYSSTG